jgi:diadenosine tetraphosphate (Ap4A) HIT family hydrolase
VTRDSNCPLCRDDGGEILWRADRLRVIHVADADYPGYTRVIWNAHVAELTSLPDSERDALMRAVYAVEQAQRDTLRPDKINLASLGNMVPHLHWHVIPRWRGDRHFPDAVWAAPRVAPGAEPGGWREQLAQRQALLPRYHERLIAALDALPR